MTVAVDDVISQYVFQVLARMSSSVVRGPIYETPTQTTRWHFRHLHGRLPLTDRVPPSSDAVTDHSLLAPTGVNTASSS